MTSIISFYSRFKDDIRAGRKTITIRNEAESCYQPEQVVRAITNPEEEEIATLKITHVEPITLDQLNEHHARQENMPLQELRELIPQIYPNESRFYVISFQVTD
ncbi:N(4)-acetylcytidine aminohydrolase [Endozoicomonadaceae bacterium StTr2]